jgi:hypothetical protein
MLSLSIKTRQLLLQLRMTLFYFDDDDDDDVDDDDVDDDDVQMITDLCLYLCVST